MYDAHGNYINQQISQHRRQEGTSPELHGQLIWHKGNNMGHKRHPTPVATNIRSKLPLGSDSMLWQIDL